jgi:protein-disulfide isomerase
VDQLLAAYPKDVRFVYKQFPLTMIHQNAMNASKAAVAAIKQGKYWEMHDELFKISRNLAIEEIRKSAEKIGLDMKKFEADMNSPETDKLIKDDMATAGQTDVSGTPTFFIGGKRVMNRTVEGMKQMVEDELKKPKGAS